MNIFETVLDTGNGTFITLVPTVGADREQWLTDEEKAVLRRLSPDRRQREWAAWHAAVRQALGPVGIGYDSCGAPILTSASEQRPDIKHISVSHTGTLAAVLFSPQRCAVDIEEAERRFDRAASRYISTTERELSCAENRYFHGIIWCLKETVYKYVPEKMPDFIRDIHIESMQYQSCAGGISGTAVCRARDECLLHANFRVEENLIIAWIA